MDNELEARQRAACEKMKSGKCEGVGCADCPGDQGDHSAVLCSDVGWSAASHDSEYEFDQTLSDSAKKWLAAHPLEVDEPPKIRYMTVTVREKSHISRRDKNATAAMKVLTRIACSDDGLAMSWDEVARQSYRMADAMEDAAERKPEEEK